MLYETFEGVSVSMSKRKLMLMAVSKNVDREIDKQNSDSSRIVEVTTCLYEVHQGLKQANTAMEGICDVATFRRKIAAEKYSI